MAKDKEKPLVSEEDKKKIVQGSKDGCLKFIRFIDKFCEFYFAASLLASAIYAIASMFAWENSKFSVTRTILAGHMIFAMLLLMAAVKGN